MAGSEESTLFHLHLILPAAMRCNDLQYYIRKLRLREPMDLTKDLQLVISRGRI